MTEGLLLLLKVSVGLLILAIGMGSTFSDLAYLWRRPALLVRSLLAMYVLVPMAAFVLVSLLPLGRDATGQPGADRVQLAGEYQIGEVHARSWCFIGTSGDIFTPKRNWS